MSEPLKSITTYAANHDNEKNKKSKKNEGKDKKEEIHKKIINSDIQNKQLEKLRTTEELFKQLPYQLLEVYHEVGGRISITDKKLTDHHSLSNFPKSLYTTDISGHVVNLEEYYVFAKHGRFPKILIQSSEDYMNDYTKDLNVYYEIGKAISRDVLSKTNILDQKFLDALNEIKKSPDAEGKDLFLSDILKNYPETFAADFLKQNKSAIQEVFAKAFAYYYEPNHRKALEIYAEPIYVFMHNFHEYNLDSLIEQIKSFVLEEPITFESDREMADRWGVAEFAKWEKRLIDDQKVAIREYTKNANPINTYLRENAGNLGSNPNLNKTISNMDAGLQTAVINDNVRVYRGTDGIIFGDAYQTSLINGSTVDLQILNDLQSEFMGKSIIEHGYLSTSLVNDTLFMARPVLLELKIPKGTPAGYVDKLSYYPGQFEIILPRNTTYKITNINIINNKQVKIEAEVLSKEAVKTE
ncbi:ADP-ribosyltransferase [Bacillus thuringiensis]|uniref:ADP-ribosyltransferase n=1 Tax=Bacillus thuringiensis TaxID=1428 RepID=UPI003CFC1ACF